MNVAATGAGFLSMTSVRLFTSPALAGMRMVERHVGGVLGAIGRFERDRAIVLDDRAAVEHVATDVVPDIVGGDGRGRRARAPVTAAKASEILREILVVCILAPPRARAVCRTPIPVRQTRPKRFVHYTP